MPSPATPATSPPVPTLSSHARRVDPCRHGHSACAVFAFPNSFMLFIKENLHRHCVGGTADRAQPAADALFVVLDHGREFFGGTVEPVELVNSGAVAVFERDLLERDQLQAMLRTNIDTAVAQHALLRVVDGLDVAIQAARCLAHCLSLREAAFDFGNSGPAAEIR